MTTDEERYADPRYGHDCTACVYLGRFEKYDLYVHATGTTNEISTILARYGDDDPEYYSGLCFCRPYISLTGMQIGPKPCMAEGLKRALELGFIDDGRC